MLRELTVLVQKQTEPNGYLLQAPTVGYLSELPNPGQILMPESDLGKITVLSNTYRLKLPSQIWGQVAQYNTDLKLRPVGYGDPIFSIVPMQEKTFDLAFLETTTDSTCQCQGRWIVRSITDGIFYRRPSPDAKPYIEVGEQVSKGQILGLVEVMKCFNKILLEGANFPSQAKLIEICAKDGAEVKYNQPLFVFE